MADSDLVVAACAVIVGVIARSRQRRRRRRIWTREWILNRQQHGAYHQLLQELRLCDENSYRNFLRMNVASFEEVLQCVSPIISRQDTHLRESISAGERLALTLRFLATGKFIAGVGDMVRMYITHTIHSK